MTDPLVKIWKLGYDEGVSVERERCAKIVEELADRFYEIDLNWAEHLTRIKIAAIRESE